MPAWQQAPLEQDSTKRPAEKSASWQSADVIGPAEQNKPSFLQRLSRGTALAARSVAEGSAGLAVPFANPIAYGSQQEYS